MGSMTNKPKPTLFFDDKPLFGLDIGKTSGRVMQLSNKSGGKYNVVGYGQIRFDPSAVADGVIVQHELIAQAIKNMFTHSLIGDIRTDRVALSIPIAHTYTRTIEVPNLAKQELIQAVRNEIEQYIPAAPESLYTDFHVHKTETERNNVFVVAIPRRIVDSYIMLARLMGLTPVLIQTTATASANLFSHDAQSELPTVLVDLGSNSADITVYERGPIVNGTVSGGGDQITRIIEKTLNMSTREAAIVKARYGLTYSKKQKEITAALMPSLEQIGREIKRNIRYYEERSRSKKTISQIVIMGGGANMPGLADALTNMLRLPVRAFDPSGMLDFGRLQPFAVTDRMSFATTAGLAAYRGEEVFL